MSTTPAAPRHWQAAGKPELPTVATPSIRPEIGRHLVHLLAVLLVLLMGAGCGTPQKGSTASERAALKRASEQAYAKAQSHFWKFRIGQHNRRDVERLLGEPKYSETKTVNGQKETLTHYWWRRYGPGPDFVDRDSNEGFDFSFDAKGILRHQALSWKMPGLKIAP